MLLNRRESLNLFTRLMFARDEPVSTMFINEVVSHAGGLPLVLKVWSRHFKQYEREEWPSVLETLKRIPHGDVHKQLKMSYDSLTNRAKKLFLDIACFFYGYPKDFVVKVLQDEEIAFFPKNEIQYLVDKSLVEITDSGSLQMHHAIREMGQEIVRQENEDEPGQRTRLRDERDVTRVLTECSGTESVESIMLSSYSEVEVQVEVFRKMSNLRLIQLNGNTSWSMSSDDERTPFCFRKLKYMVWECFPFKRINSINMTKVVVLRLMNSKLEILWEGIKSLKKLRILDVNDSLSLTKTGDFYGLENLEELDFKGCRNLKELHHSISCLQKLAILDLTRSIALNRIPWEMIVKLPSLRQLTLTKSEKILTTPNLRRYNASSNMPEPNSLTDPVCPKFGSEKPLFLMEVSCLTNLSHLSMRGCNVWQIPKEIGNLVSLQTLDLSENTFSSLPDSFSNLSQLATLNIADCSRLRLLPLIPPNLTYIIASGCWSLDVMPFDSTQRSYIFRTKVCKESSLSKSIVIHIPMRKKEIPDWCSYQKREGVLSFVAPTYISKKLCGIILYAKNTESLWILSPKMFNKTKNTSHCLTEMELRYDSVFVMFYPLDHTTLVVEAGDTVIFEFPQNSILRCGLRLIYDSDVVDSDLVIQHVNDIQDDCINQDEHSNDEYNSDDG
ncbi:TMV resistance protein N-like [Bidens hawaiensis]|uniref:TMV resistance protein N-like n=1 Tax=Bidens hawaiensis TaxID=980011 RepID=UPI0040490CBD